MTTWLALDVGDKRVGLAAGSDEVLLARPLSVLTRRSRQQDFDAIAAAADEVQATCLLAGLPYNMDGSEGPQAKRVRNYIRRLQGILPLPVTFWDERLSSFEADFIIKSSSNKRRKYNDDVAAACILQSYFESLRKPSPHLDGTEPAD